MQTTTLGRTGRTVSVAGLGCGGSSRLGLSQGRSEEECAAIVRQSIDAGVNFIDTAEAYGTEGVVGLALKDIDRDAVMVSTKSRYRDAEGLFPAATIIANLEASLGRLGLDTVDVFHVHAVRPADYDRVMADIVTALEAQKAKGKIRHIGITESPPNDARQEMMARAVNDGVWEVVMLAFHLMNHGPVRTMFPATQANGIGTLIMFAVRSIFSRPARLREAMRELADQGLVAEEFATRDDPLAFLVEESGAGSLTEVAYRFARHRPGVDVVLFGTGNPDHVRSNIEAINAPPLPDAVVAKIETLFGHLTGVGFDLPEPARKG
ncbi:aldo/keto reductase [Acuticoccus kandeliae]|uniref:aldo/keto reductase n=1 Tax=Acuticoccus kandeliae TaxID=2073160 RepID=UPI000D3EA7C2|nr:aldo/keto reductase [Acuticoccus kandeliae]